MNLFRLLLILFVSVLSSNFILAQCPGTPPLAFTFESTESRCENNGTITLHIEGGAPFTDVNGNPIYNNTIIAPIVTPIGGQSDSIFAGIAAGVYTVEVVDANGCSVTQQITVPGTHMQLELEIEYADVKCNENGWICGTPAEGRPFPPGYYEYQLYDASTIPATPLGARGLDSCFTNLAVGMYQIRAYDSCENFQTRDITIIAKQYPSELTLAIGSYENACTERCIYILAYGNNNLEPEYPVSWVVTSSTYLPFVGLTGQIDFNGDRDTFCVTPMYETANFTLTFTDACGLTKTLSRTFNPYSVSSIATYSCQNGSGAQFIGNSYCAAGTTMYETTQVPAGAPAIPTQNSGEFNNLEAGEYCWRVTECCGNVATSCRTIVPPAWTLNVRTLSVFTCDTGLVSISVRFRRPNNSPAPSSSADYILNSAPIGYNSPNMLPDTFRVLDRITGPPGTYCFTLEDDCLSHDSCFVVNTPLYFDYESVVTEGCVTGNSVEAIFTQTGGTSLPLEADFHQISPVMATIQEDGTNLEWLNLSAGTYVIELENGNSNNNGNECNLVVDTIVIPEYVQPSISGTWGIECDDGVGLIVVEGSAGNTPYTYELFQGPVTRPLQSSPNFPGLPIGTYDIRMYDNCGNSETTTQAIEPFMPVIQGYTGVSCIGDSLVLYVDYFGFATYSWTGPNGATSDSSVLVIPNVSTADVGTFTVNIDVKNPDQTACIAQTLTLPVNVLDCSCAIDTVVGTDLSCFGGSDGMASVITTNGVPPYTFLWSNGEVTQDISDLTAGLYTVTVSDANSCSVTGEVSLTAPDSLTVSVMEINVFCNGASDGSITATTAGGTPSSGGCTSVSYLWSNGATTAIINNLVAGMYIVTATDCNGCTATAEAAVSEPSLIAIAASSTDVSCINGEDGSITLAVTGGTVGIPNCSDYTYLWNNGAITSTVSNLAAGMYTVTITDCNGCSATSAAAINEPSPFAINASTANVSCANGADGSIALSVSGGTIGTATCMDYTYLWSNGATTAAITGLVAGGYNFTVSDCNGCSEGGLLVISEPVAIVCAITGTNASCNGGSDGSAAIAVTGGIAPYTYSWSNGATSDMISGLIAGTYSATVTDDLGCSTTCDVQIVEPVALFLTYELTDIRCFGDSTGAIDVTYTGGTACAGPVDLFISEYIEGSGNNKCIEIFNGTGAAIDLSTYSLAVYANGNANPTGTYNFQTVMLADNDVYVVCNSSATAIFTAAADVLSGVMNFNGDDAVVLRNNGASVDIFGNIGCDPGSLWSAGGNVTQNRTLVRNPIVSGGIVLDDQTSCPFFTLGTEWTELPQDDASNIGMHTFAGGSGDGFTFEWNTGATTSLVTGLSGGMYTVTVTDCNGCSAIETVTLATPSQITISDSTQHVSCNDGEDGSITLIVSGGTVLPNCSDYTYTWSNGASGASTTGLTAGTYMVTVVDCNGCTTTDSYVINEPLELSCSISANEILCSETSDGTATVTATGGTAPYMYLWSSGEITPAISGLSAGTYNVTVTDSLGCITDCSIIIEGPPMLTVMVAGTDLFCNGDSNGSITATTTGGTQIGTVCTGVSYLWDNGATTSSISGLSVGTYSVTATDCNGCTATAALTINEPAELSCAIVGTDVECHGGGGGTATVLATGGEMPYSYIWSNGTATNPAINLGVGDYTATVTDNNGCLTTCMVSINESPKLTSAVSVVNVSCDSTSDGQATVVASGGTPGYTYQWDAAAGGVTTSTVTGLVPGTYQVSVVDANGCCDITSVIIAKQAGCEVLCTDLSPILTIVPSNINGISQIGVVIEITELNNIDTDGSLITVRLLSDPRLTFVWDPTLTSVGFNTVNNANWTYLGDSGLFHSFTYNGPTPLIAGGTVEAFGMLTTYDPQSTDGQTTLTTSIVPFSGGECEITNNSDSETLVYFN